MSTLRAFRAAWTVLAVSVCAVMPAVLPASAHADQRQTGLGLDITSSRSTYRPGQEVTLTFRVTNHGPAACQVGTIADGEVLIGSVTRDGAAQAWSASQREYRVAYASTLAGGLVTVQPGEHVDVAVSALAGPQAGTEPLRTVSVVPTGVGLASAWTLDADGRYLVSARYKTPEVPGAQVCAGATNVATVAFAVGSVHRGFPWWWLLVALAVLVVSLVLYVAIRRRRGRRAARTAAAVALVLCAATAGPVARPTAALADPVGGDAGAFDKMIGDCLDQLTGPGVEPGLIDRVRSWKQNGQLGIRRSYEVPGDKTSLGANQVLLPGGIYIWKVVVDWNPNDHSPYVGDPKAKPDTCANLYHELLHAETVRAGSQDNRRCSLPGYPGAHFTTYDEVRTIEWENQYRLSKDLGVRHRHDEGPKVDEPVPPVPASATGKSPAEQVQAALDTCSPLAPDPDAGSKPEHRVGDGGETTGDPHIATFDHLHYDFQAVGEFVLAESRDDFEVQVRQAPFSPGDRTIAVDTAAAVRAGSDRVGFYDVDGDIQVRLGGRTLTPARGSTKLPGGATLSRRAGVYDYTGDGYDVIWPDGSIVSVDPLGSEGLRVGVLGADTRHGTFSGLLGNFDGKSAGDLASREGRQIPDQPGFDDLYRVFGDSWRLSPGESMLEYGPGQSTATFTDRAFPDKPTTVADLPKSVRDEASAMCKAAGVTDPTLFDDCVVDVARTGQPSFAAEYAQDQWNLVGAAGGGPAPTGPGGPGPGRTVDKPGAVLQDGDVVTGRVDTADGTVDYGLDLGAGQQFELVDVTGSISAEVPDTEPGTPLLPGPFQFAVQTTGQARLRISMPNGGTGEFAFRYVTLKPRPIPIEVGASPLSGTIDEPGRVDVYRFTAPPDVTMVQVGSTASCDSGLTYGFAADGPEPGVLSPGQLCFGYAHSVTPGATELVLVWSDGAKTGSYSIGVQRS